MHVEQLGLTSVHTSIRGTGRWWAIGSTGFSAFFSALLTILRSWGLDVSELEQDEARTTQLLWALIFARVLWLDPFELRRLGVPVGEIALGGDRELVVTSGECIHWGIGDDEYQIGAAINCETAMWFEGGLQFDLRMYIPCLHAVHAALQQPRRPTGSNSTIDRPLMLPLVRKQTVHHMPHSYSCSFLRICSCLLGRSLNGIGPRHLAASITT